jgi:hypothetical protein
VDGSVGFSDYVADLGCKRRNGGDDDVLGASGCRLAYSYIGMGLLAWFAWRIICPAVVEVLFSKSNASAVLVWLGEHFALVLWCYLAVDEAICAAKFLS